MASNSRRGRRRPSGPHRLLAFTRKLTHGIAAAGDWNEVPDRGRIAGRRRGDPGLGRSGPAGGPCVVSASGRRRTPRPARSADLLPRVRTEIRLRHQRAVSRRLPQYGPAPRPDPARAVLGISPLSWVVAPRRDVRPDRPRPRDDGQLLPVPGGALSHRPAYRLPALDPVHRLDA